MTPRVCQELKKSNKLNYATTSHSFRLERAEHDVHLHFIYTDVKELEKMYDACYKSKAGPVVESGKIVSIYIGSDQAPRTHAARY